MPPASLIPVLNFFGVFLLRVYFSFHGFHFSTFRVTLCLSRHVRNSPAPLKHLWSSAISGKALGIPHALPLPLVTKISKHLVTAEYLLLCNNWMIRVSRWQNDMGPIFERQWLRFSPERLNVISTSTQLCPTYPEGSWFLFQLRFYISISLFASCTHVHDHSLSCPSLTDIFKSGL